MTPLILSLMLALLTALGVLMAVDAVLHTRTAQGTLAWVFVLVFVPLVGLPLYFVFGSRRFNGYVRARRRGNERINRLASHVYIELKPHATFAQPTQQGVAIDYLGLLPMTHGNDARLLVNGQETFEAIFGAIDAAERYVLVQFYILRDDGLGERLAEGLIAAAARGVRCYVLYDEIGSSGLRRLVARLRDGGVSVSAFKTTKGPRNRFQLNFRNHRKIVVVDGRVAHVGGHNVGDEYVDGDPSCAPWRDTHLELVGPCVQAVQLSFCEDWNWAVGTVPELEWHPRTVEADERVMIVPSGPADEVETFLLLTLQLIALSRERVWIASPYFVPDESLIAALQLAALRGVDVRLIVPRDPDSVLVRLAARSYWPDLIPCGVRVFEHAKGFMHQKVMLLDGVSCVGTANLDNRSLRINFEVTAIVDDAGFAKQTAAMLQADLADCTEIGKDHWRKLGLGSRLSSRVARMFSPVL